MAADMGYPYKLPTSWHAFKPFRAFSRMLWPTCGGSPNAPEGLPGSIGGGLLGHAASRHHGAIGVAIQAWPFIPP